MTEMILRDIKLPKKSKKDEPKTAETRTQKSIDSNSDKLYWTTTVFFLHFLCVFLSDIMLLAFSYQNSSTRKQSEQSVYMLTTNRKRERTQKTSIFGFIYRPCALAHSFSGLWSLHFSQAMTQWFNFCSGEKASRPIWILIGQHIVCRKRAIFVWLLRNLCANYWDAVNISFLFLLCVCVCGRSHEKVREKNSDHRKIILFVGSVHIEWHKSIDWSSFKLKAREKSIDRTINCFQNPSWGQNSIKKFKLVVKVFCMQWKILDTIYI